MTRYMHLPQGDAAQIATNRPCLRAGNRWDIAQDMLEACRASETPRFIFTSTCKVGTVHVSHVVGAACTYRRVFYKLNRTLKKTDLLFFLVTKWYDHTNS